MRWHDAVWEIVLQCNLDSLPRTPFLRRSSLPNQAPTPQPITPDRIASIGNQSVRPAHPW